MKKKKMVKKKKVVKRVVKNKISKKTKNKIRLVKKNVKKFPSLKLKREHDIAMDFGVKVYKKFDKIVKSVVLFGSTIKHASVSGSDIDIIVIIDDVSVSWDQELIAWYREELDRLLKVNPYAKSLHINTIKLSTWWQDLLRGEPILINILRYGEALVDVAGFFNPLKQMLLAGKIKSTPEAIYSALNRAPIHLARSKVAELNAIEGLYWCMVDAAHAALISANVIPPSPEHIPVGLKENFVNSGKLKMKYVLWYRDLLILHKKIMHGEIKDLKGVEIDQWQDRAEEFLDVMAKLVGVLIEKK